MSRKDRPYEHWGNPKELAFIRMMSRRNQYGEYDLNDYTPIQFMGEPNPEPVICSHFGCGRTLSQREQMFGQRCIHHSEKPLTRPLC